MLPSWGWAPLLRVGSRQAGRLAAKAYSWRTTIPLLHPGKQAGWLKGPVYAALLFACTPCPCCWLACVHASATWALAARANQSWNESLTDKRKSYLTQCSSPWLSDVCNGICCLLAARQAPAAEKAHHRPSAAGRQVGRHLMACLRLAGMRRWLRCRLQVGRHLNNAILVQQLIQSEVLLVKDYLNGRCLGIAGH